MGKKKDNSRNLFSESIDPRFNGIFNSSKDNDSREKYSNALQCYQNITTECKNSKANESTSFQNFISKKLAEFLDSHIKEVDRPVSDLNFYSKKQESIQLFSDSDAIVEEQPVESIQKRPLKKKRKKDREDKELLKEVAVSFEFLQRQAKILNS